MTFEFEEIQYRIGFRHDKPRDWSAHMRPHRGLYDKTEQPKVSLRTDKARGPVLFCDLCECALAPFSPALGTKLKGGPRPRMVARELARNCHCIIYRHYGQAWESMFSGCSRLNTDAGDAYNREAGRMAALRDALPKADSVTIREDLREAFCKAAMRAYRPEIRVHRKSKGKGGSVNGPIASGAA